MVTSGVSSTASGTMMTFPYAANTCIGLYTGTTTLQRSALPLPPVLVWNTAALLASSACLEIARRGVFGEVYCAFWKEEPSLRQVLHMVDADDIYVVPNFISEGYFTQTVIPRELGLTVPPPVPSALP